MSVDVPHRRPEPSEWPQLVEQSRAIVGDERDPFFGLAEDQVRTLYEHVATLDDCALETNHYYGLGKALCGFAARLNNEEEREESIQNAVQYLAKYNYFNREPDGLRIRDIGWRGHRFNMIFGGLFHDTAQAAVKEMPFAEATLTDTLTACNLDRRQGNILPEQRVRDLMFRDTTVKRINQTADQATSILIKYALLARAGAEPASYVKDIVSPEELRSLPLGKVARLLACLRFDEFISWAHEDPENPWPQDIASIVRTEADGTLTGDWTYLNRTLGEGLPEVAPFDGHPTVLRKERLACPALHVKGLIPLMLQVVPEIIVRTNEAISNRNTQIEGQ